MGVCQSCAAESPSPAIIAASNHCTCIPTVFPPSRPPTLSRAPSASLDAVEEKQLNPSPSSVNSNLNNAVELYFHVGGSSLSARWIISEKHAPCIFFNPSSSNPDDCSGADDDEEENPYSSSPWLLKIGSKLQVRVGPEMVMKSFPDQGRVEFVAVDAADGVAADGVAADGVWSVKFSSTDAYKNFQIEYLRYSFENSYGFEINEENKVKVFGKDFMAAWAETDSDDDSIWEDARESFETDFKY